MNSPLRLRLAVCTALAATGISATAATDYSWNVTTNGNWSDTAKWDPTGSPSLIDDTATISLAGTYSVSLTADVSIGGLTLNNANATLATGSQSLRVSGPVLFQAGAMTGNGTIVDSGSLTLGASSGLGTFTMEGTSTLTGDVGVSTTVVIKSPSAIGTASVTTGSFTNNGYIELNPVNDGVTELNGELLTNATTGEIAFSAASFIGHFNADLVNNGLVTVAASGLAELGKFGGTYANNSQFVINANASVQITNSGSFQQNSGTLNNLGAFNILGGTFAFNGGTLTGNSPVLEDSNLQLGAGGGGTGSVILQGANALLEGNVGTNVTVLIQPVDGGSPADAVVTSFTSTLR